jgi:translation initiation factor 2 subunit 1
MEFPKRNEFLICKVEKIFPYGAEVSIEEYDGLKGFVHLSQVAPRWIKNIRNFLKIGQIKVGRVTSINTLKNQVDISFAVVSDAQQNQKINEWRQTKRVQQLLKILADKTNKDFEDVWDLVVNPILETYDSVYEAFKEIIIYGKDHVKNIPEDLKAELHEILSKNIVIHEKKINEIMKIKSEKSDAILKIKDTFKKIPEDEKVKIETNYMGNGKYAFKFVAADYKTIEKHLLEINTYMEKSVKKYGTIEIKREKTAK